MTSRTRTSIWALGYAVGPMVLFILSRRPIVDNSFLWHITAGRVQLDGARVLTTDPFSFTFNGAPWRTQSWLVELGYGVADSAFGIGFGHYVAPIVGGLVFLVMATIVRVRANTGLATALAMAGSAVLMIPFLQPRPVIVSYLALALLVLLTHRPKLHWAIPLVVWMWAGSHGSFPLAFVLLGTEWFGSRERSLVKAGVASLVLTLFTAHGWGIIEILMGFARSSEALDRITEWQPPDLLEPMFIPATLALALVIRLAARQGIPKRSGFPWLAWFVFGLSSIRAMPLAWIVLLPVIAEASRDAVGERLSTSRMPRPVIAFVAAALILSPLLIPIEEEVSATRFPLEAKNQLTADRVFHDDVSGGYLIYDEWPDRLVYIDDRAELYGSELVAFADAQLGDPSWQELFDEWQFEQALVRNEEPIASILTVSPDWAKTYEDDSFSVFDRVQRS